MIRIPLHVLLLSVALFFTFSVYVRGAFFEFVYDDFGQIVYNPRIHSWKFAWTTFTSHVWAQTGDLPLYYRPLFMLWLTANHTLFGLNPFLWHMAAIGLYLGSCILLYLFIRHLPVDGWVAVVAVLLFALHPAHLEVVAWVSGATESLLGALLFGSLLCYVKYRERRAARGWLVASLCLTFCAVLTKETALIIPGLIFAYEWAFHRGGASWREKICSPIRAALPYITVSIAFLFIRALALKSLTPPHTTVGLRSVLLAWPQVITFYTAHMLLPVQLSVFYTPLIVPHPGFRNFVLPMIVVATVAAALYYGSRRSQIFTFLALWCALMLLPMLNVTLWRNLENVHDRYLYLPSAAYCLIIAVLLSRLRELRYTKSALVVLTVMAAGSVYLTEREIGYWRSDHILAQHGVSVSPGHPIAAQLLGNAYIREGRVSEAVPWLVESLEGNPQSVQTLCSLAFCYSEMNALPLAEESVTRAISLKKSDPRGHLVLGMIRLKQHRLVEAEAELRSGIRLQHKLTPGNTLMFHYYLGEVLYAKGDIQGAIEEYRWEVRNDRSIDAATARAWERLEELRSGVSAR